MKIMNFILVNRNNLISALIFFYKNAEIIKITPTLSLSEKISDSRDKLWKSLYIEYDIQCTITCTSYCDRFRVW